MKISPVWIVTNLLKPSIVLLATKHDDNINVVTMTLNPIGKNASLSPKHNDKTKALSNEEDRKCIFRVKM